MKTAAPLPVGTLLANGRYQLQQVLGQGGFAITYLALDTQLKRAVAIKELCPEGCIRDAHNQVAPIMLPPDLFAQIRQRFIEEAQLVAQLNHPGIVHIYDVFQQNNTGYMVMEYLHGETLGAKLRRAGGVLPVEEAVDYILQVCDALEVVHRAGYIHRDIKPDNIIHCEDGRLVLIDFGAARQFVANQTATYTVMFTPSYAAPEQYSSSGRLDQRTDIYGLAATLYHLVTGSPPLPVLDRTSGLDLPPPHLIEPGVGEALSRVILQGLSMRRDERPASVAAFAQLIQSALKEDLQPAAPPPPVPQPPPQPTPQPAPPPATQPSPQPAPPSPTPIPVQSSSGSLDMTPDDSFIDKPSNLLQTSLEFFSDLLDTKFGFLMYLLVCSALGVVLVHFGYITFKAIAEFFSPTVIKLSPADSQETIIKAFKRIRPEGTIRLESGSYHIDTDIIIEKPLKLVGVSGSVSIATNHKSLIFRAGGDSQVQNISFQNTAIRVEKGAVAISRCNFTAGGANYSAIKVTNTASVRVEECVIRGYLRGIFADRDAVLKAYNNICESHKQLGISLFGSAQGEVSGNTCRNNEDGIVANDQSRLVAKNNTCEGNKDSGIVLFDSAQGEVEGNARRNNRYYGIYADEQSRLVARNNTCEGNKQDGIGLFGKAQGEVSGNACRNNGYHGIAAHEQSRLVAKNNTCEGNKDCGIFLYGRALGTVENNTCAYNKYGVYSLRTVRAYVGYNECYGNSEGNLLLNQ